MSPKLAKRVEWIRRILAKGSHYLVLTAPAEERPPRRAPRPG